MREYSKKQINTAYMDSFRSDKKEGFLSEGDMTKNGMPSKAYKERFDKLIKDDPSILDFWVIKIGGIR